MYSHFVQKSFCYDGLRHKYKYTQSFVSVCQTVLLSEHRQTDSTQKGKTDSMTSTADAGGKDIYASFSMT